MSEKNILEIQNVSLSDANPDGKYLLREINLAVSRSSFIAITGANGSGKTLLLLVLYRPVPAKSFFQAKISPN